MNEDAMPWGPIVSGAIVIAIVLVIVAFRIEDAIDQLAERARDAK